MATQHEVGLHIGIVQALRLDFMPEHLLFYHCPSGGLRHPVEAIKLQKMGVAPGVPDLTFHWPSYWELDGVKTTILETGYIEIKTEWGELSPPQEAFRDRVRAWGGRYGVARNYETVKKILIEWGIPCQNRVQL